MRRRDRDEYVVPLIAERIAGLAGGQDGLLGCRVTEESEDVGVREIKLVTFRIAHPLTSLMASERFQLPNSSGWSVRFVISSISLDTSLSGSHLVITAGASSTFWGSGVVEGAVVVVCCTAGSPESFAFVKYAFLTLRFDLTTCHTRLSTQRSCSSSSDGGVLFPFTLGVLTRSSLAGSPSST
jgi:hypothetical protein